MARCILRLSGLMIVLMVLASPVASNATNQSTAHEGVASEARRLVVVTTPHWFSLYNPSVTEAELLSESEAPKYVVEDADALRAFGAALKNLKSSRGSKFGDIRMVITFETAGKTLDQLSVPVTCDAMFHDGQRYAFDRVLFRAIVQQIPRLREQFDADTDCGRQLKSR